MNSLFVLRGRCAFCVPYALVTTNTKKTQSTRSPELFVEEYHF